MYQERTEKVIKLEGKWVQSGKVSKLRRIIRGSKVKMNQELGTAGTFWNQFLQGLDKHGLDRKG